MQILAWAFRALVFFALFAFALNNQHDATVHWFFGRQWQAPMIFIVLAAFALGCAFGVFAMVPSWWRHRRVATRQREETAPTPATTFPVATTPAVLSDAAPEHPPRDGL